MIKNRMVSLKQRGVAILTVLLLITLVTAVISEVQFNSRIDLQLAYNSRDALQAEYNALAALRLRAMLLKHSKRLDMAAKQLAQTFGADSSSLPLGQILEMIPIECGILGSIIKVDGFMDERDDFLPGECIASSKSEGAKIPVNLLASRSTNEVKDIAMMLLGVLIDPEYERHFQEDDENGQHADTAMAIVAAIADWVDTNTVQFGTEVGDEAHPYSMMKEGYSVKNAAFDSVSELQLVFGVDDELFAILKDLITIYPQKSQIELGTLSIEDVLRFGLPAILQEGVTFETYLTHPGLLDFLTVLLGNSFMGGPLGLNANSLNQALTASGMIDIVDGKKLKAVFSDKDQTSWFTLESQGMVGKATFKYRTVFNAKDQGRFFYARID